MRALLLVLAAGCGRIAFDPLGGDAGGMTGSGDGPLPACTSFGAWSMPQEVPALTTMANDWEAALHPDGELLVFAREFDGLYTARRAGDTFIAPARIDLFGSGELGPTWSPSGDQLFFIRDTGGGTYRLFASDYSGGVFQPPVQVADLASEPVLSAAFTPDGLELYFGDASIGGRIKRAARSTESSPWVVTGVETQLTAPGANDVGWASIAGDSLTMYFEVIASDGPKIYTATRASTAMRFDSPMIVPGLVQTTADDVGDPEISRDGRMLLMAYLPDGSTAGFDMYVSTRPCLSPRR